MGMVLPLAACSPPMVPAISAVASVNGCTGTCFFSSSMKARRPCSSMAHRIPGTDPGAIAWSRWQGGSLP